MRTAEHASKVCLPERLLLGLVLVLGCEAGGSTGTETLAYRDPGIPESEHRNIVRALQDLSGPSVHQRLMAERYFQQMGIAIGARLVPYWEQLLESPHEEARVAVTRLIIEFCGQQSALRLVGFLESENEAVRRDAYRKLLLVTGREYGYRYDAPKGERAEAVRRIRQALSAAGI